ncbi:MAG: hypothetical protein KBD21_00760 [Candidatus Pacebacteria bacterium]|nr:hypothetical protein [Candidatus Paceibacterota bacterium]
MKSQDKAAYPFREVMQSLLDSHIATLLSFVPDGRCVVCSIAQTDGELPRLLLRARRGMETDVRGVTCSRHTVDRARRIVASVAKETTEYPGSVFNVYEVSPSRYAQRRMGVHDIVYYIPHIPDLLTSPAVENARYTLHNIVCRCVGALKAEGVLVMVLINPTSQLTHAFRAVLLDCVLRALDFSGAHLLRKCTLELCDLRLPEGLSEENSDVARSCVLIAARKSNGEV